MIGQSLINTSNGARARLSGIVAAVMLLVFIMFGAGLIEKVPMAALTGLMIMVALGTFEWASLRTFRRMPKSGVADHPAVGLNYDNMHPYRYDESLEITEQALGDRICHTHFHDAMKVEKVEIVPLDKGELPMDDMFQLLLRKGYAGYLSGEWFNEQYGPDPDTALAAFHRDMTELARRNGVTLGE
jgi:hypothetical protein